MVAQDTHPEKQAGTLTERSIMDNELPSYRAVSVWAIMSLLLGLASVFSFASYSFLAAAVGAVVCGAVALRRLKRYPELLTGSAMANLGIAIGLICGLASVTVGYTRDAMIKRDAMRFATAYCEVLQKGGIENALYLHSPPAARADTTPEGLMEIIQKESAESFEMDPRTMSIRDVLAKLAKSKEEHVHTADVEGFGFEGLTPKAYVSIAFDGPESDKTPAERYALLTLEGQDVGGRREWFVQTLTYPYASGSKAQSNVVESAHGHAH